MAFQFDKYKDKSESTSSEERTQSSGLAKILWTALMALLMIYIYFVPLYFKNTGGFLEGFLTVVIPVIFFPFLLYKLFVSFSHKSKYRIAIPVVSIFIFPVCLMFLNSYLVFIALGKETGQTKCVVTEKITTYTNKQKKKVSEKNYYCEYEVEQKVYKSCLDVRDLPPGYYKQGDSLDVVYSLKHANIHKIWRTTKE